MKVVLLFPGFGSQFVGMGKELYDEYRIIQEYFEEAANCLNVNFVKLCFASSEAELAKMPNTYTATFLVSCSIAALLKEQGINPTIAVGCNFGEFAAIHTAGGISFPDGLYVLNKFATFYQEALESMDVAAIQVYGMEFHTLEQLCNRVNDAGEHANIALYTTPTEHTVSGTRAGIALLQQKLAVYGIKSDDVSIEVGLHSQLAEPIAKQVRMYLEKVDFKDAVFPVLDTVTMKTIEQGVDIKESFVAHIQNPIRWNESLDTLADYDVYIEVGPGSKLAAMVKEKYPDKLIVSINKKADLQDLKNLLESSQESKDTHGI